MAAIPTTFAQRSRITIMLQKYAAAAAAAFHQPHFGRFVLEGTTTRRASSMSVATTSSYFDMGVPSRTASMIIPSSSSSSTLLLLSSKRSHYSYAGPGRFDDNNNNNNNTDFVNNKKKRLQTFSERGFTVGIGGPVGSGKTALVLALIKRLAPATTSSSSTGDNNNHPPLGVVTNDIFTQEDAQFLHKNQSVLDKKFIKAVETGGCPHAAIREDVSANLTACEDLTKALLLLPREKNDDTSAAQSSSHPPPLILCESGGDNLAANFSRELADLTLYVIDVAGGDKVPRKGGPGITQSDLLVINKIDLAEAVGADLDVMRRDANTMRQKQHPHGSDRHNQKHDNDHDDDSGPTVFASVKQGTGLDEIQHFILEEYAKAVLGGK